MPEDNARFRVDRTGYDPITGTYHAHHDWEGRSSLCYTILSTVAALVDKEPLAVESFSNVVDTDALNDLFESSLRGGSPSDGVRFTIEGCDVVARRDGHIIVEPPDQASDRRTG